MEISPWIWMPIQFAAAAALLVIGLKLKGAARIALVTFSILWFAIDVFMLVALIRGNGQLDLP